jgi:hypothetical protein
MSDIGADDITVMMRAAQPAPGFGIPTVPGYTGPKDVYEFTGEENETILRLSGAMSTAGIIQAVFGGMEIVAGLIGMFAGWGFPVWMILGSGLALLVTGIWMRQAANSLDLVVHSRGSDILNLMDSFERLTSIFNLQRAWYALGILFSVAMVIVTIWFWLQQKPG